MPRSFYSTVEFWGQSGW